MKKAFTLVELMIVVAVLGILAAIVLPTVQGHTSDAREASAKDNLRALRGQVEMYKMHHSGVQPGYVSGSATGSATTLAKQFTNCTNLTGTPSLSQTPVSTYIYGPYFMTMPENPFNELNDIKIVLNAETFAGKADDLTGWMYKIETGEIRCNSTGTDDDSANHYDY